LASKETGSKKEEVTSHTACLLTDYGLQREGIIVLRWVIKMVNLLKKFGRQRTGIYSSDKHKDEPLSSSIQANMDKIHMIFKGSNDVVIREFRIGTCKKIKGFIVYIDGLVDKRTVNESIMKPLMLAIALTQQKDGLLPKNTLTFIKEQVLSIVEVTESGTLEDVVSAVLSGDAAVFLDSSPVALLANARGWEARGIEEPKTEAVVRGSREGFTETLRTSTAQLRRKIKNQNLKIETMKIGRQTKTDVCIAYIRGIANDKIVEEVKRRLKRIDTDSILESGYLEQFIEDSPLSFFPTVGNSEKPDVLAAKILEGRIGIITDGTPFVLTVPYLFIEGFQVSEDYYSRPYYATLIRWVRFTAFFLSVFLPALYVALTTFHQEMIPSILLVTMAAAKEGTPFPAFVEALGMGIVFEILKEAGVRLPRPVGQAVSIVGALVIGEAAVTAGLIGAPMVIVVALTAIASFAIPSLVDVGAVMRLFLLIAAAGLGLFGVTMATLGILTHMVSLRSFGIPYLSPLAPTTAADLKDVLIRAPLWAMVTRPRVIGWQNPVRQKFHLKPEPTEDE
jgi:spore germination protein KA